MSVAKWPYPDVRLGNSSNSSTDTHETKEQALAVIRGLEREGFGGQGRVFPIEVYITEVSNELRRT
jgi:hypothetical protein